VMVVDPPRFAHDVGLSAGASRPLARRRSLLASYVSIARVCGHCTRVCEHCTRVCEHCTHVVSRRHDHVRQISMPALTGRHDRPASMSAHRRRSICRRDTPAKEGQIGQRLAAKVDGGQCSGWPPRQSCRRVRANSSCKTAAARARRAAPLDSGSTRCTAGLGLGALHRWNRTGRSDASTVGRPKLIMISRRGRPACNTVGTRVRKSWKCSNAHPGPARPPRGRPARPRRRRRGRGV
jgi:hypothetical protein